MSHDHRCGVLGERRNHIGIAGCHVLASEVVSQGTITHEVLVEDSTKDAEQRTKSIGLGPLGLLRDGVGSYSAGSKGRCERTVRGNKVRSLIHVIEQSVGPRLPD